MLTSLGALIQFATVVIKMTRSRVGQPGFTSQLCPLLAVWLTLGKYSTSLSFN